MVRADDDSSHDVTALVSYGELQHVPDLKGERYSRAILLPDLEQATKCELFGRTCRRRTPHHSGKVENSRAPPSRASVDHGNYPAIANEHVAWVQVAVNDVVVRERSNRAVCGGAKALDKGRNVG